MNAKKSYPEEIFEWRLNKYKGKARKKLPHQVEFETSQRVNNLVRKVVASNSRTISSVRLSAKIKKFPF